MSGRARLAFRTGFARIWPAAASLLIASCSPAPRSRDVVLVTIDTLRADRLGCSGNPVVRTPGLDRCFRRATQFSEAYTCAPTTLASHASMLTGLWPSGHGVPRNGWPLSADIVTVPELLSTKGIARGAFVSSAALDPSFGLDQGFEIYDFEPVRTVARDQGWRPASATLQRALSWWRTKAPGRRFLFVHLFEPHFPYEPDPRDTALYEASSEAVAAESNGSMEFLFSLWDDPARFTPGVRDRLLALYHAEITGLDRVLGRALEEFAADGPLLIVTSDHGESLGEHRLQFKHGLHVYEGDTHIPLAIRGGDPFSPGVADALVRSVDLAPTMLAALGVSAKSDIPDCVDLASRARGGEDLPVFAEASMPWNAEQPGEYPNRFKQKSLRTRSTALVVTPWSGASEWFDRTRDPGETSPRPVPDSPEAERLSAKLQEWGSRGAPREHPTGVDPALIETLRGLGYVDR